MLDNNDFGDKGLCAIADSLMINKTLQSINLSQQNSGVSLEFLERLNEALLHNTKLVRVCFNTKELRLQSSVTSHISTQSPQVPILTPLDEKKSQIFSRIVKHL